MNLPLSCPASRPVSSLSLFRFTVSVLVLAPLVVLPPHVHASLPTGAEIVHGNVAIAQAGSAMTITQTSSHAIVNWQSFNIGAGESLRLAQSGASAAMLARVVGGTSSELLGSLQADGKLFLINPKGILIGAGAVIDTASFMATTLDAENEAFLAGGEMAFSGDSAAGVVNLGRITAREGNVMLFAHTVKNAGEINAPKGSAALLAGTYVYLAAPDSASFFVELNLPSSTATTGVENSGVIAAAQAELNAAGGSIYDLAVNQSGIVRATGVVNRNGRVILTAEGGAVQVSGNVTARNADGSGGEILVGADHQDREETSFNSARTTVAATAHLDASGANDSVAAGRAIVRATDTLTFLGKLSARGTGGGFAEVAGDSFLDFRPASTPDVGSAGTLQLAAGALHIGATNPGAAGLSFLSTSALQSYLAASKVTLDTSRSPGDITFGSAFTWGANALTVKSGNNINVNANLTGGAGSSLFLKPGKPGSASDDSGRELDPRITLNEHITLSVGTLEVGVNSDAAPAGYDVRRSDTGYAPLDGVLNVGTLQIDLTAGIMEVRATNAANAIGTLRTSGTGNFRDIDVVDGSGGLDVMLTSVNSRISMVRVTTPGTLTLKSGTSLNFAIPTNVILASTGGAFVNQAGATPFGANARYLIYTSTPAATTRGGLAPTYVFNKTFDPSDAFTTYGGDTTSRLIYSGSKATVTFTANNQSRVYGDASAAPTAAASGFVDGDTLATSGIAGAPTLAHTATQLSNVGNHAITAANGTLAGTTFYDVAVANGTLAITPAPLAIAVENKSRTYGDANPTFTAAFTGLKNSDTAASVGTLSFTSGADQNSNAGTYAINAALSGANSNYTATIAPGTLTVNKAPLTVSVSNSITKAQGALNPDFLPFTTAAGLKLTDTLATAIPNLGFDTLATTTSPDGTYLVTPTGTSANYSLSFNAGLLTISTVVLPTLTYRADDASRVYGDVNPLFNFTRTGLLSGTPDDVTGAPMITTFATQSSGVGSYTLDIQRGTLRSNNYQFSFVPGSLTITPAPLTVAIDNASRLYGDANPAFTSTVTGMKNSDPASVAGSLAFSTVATPTSNVGAYAISGALSGTSANYTATITPGTLTVNQAPLTITVNNASRAFGAANPAFSASFTGFKNSETSAVLSGLAFSTMATTTSPLGTYPITATASSTNYALTFTPGLLTISNALLTFAAGNASRIYGDANPSFNYSVTGFQNGDTAATAFTGAPSITTTAQQSSGVGSYAITIGRGTLASANYDFAFTNGSLSITPAPLSITPNNASRTYGDPNPAFTATYTGLKNGDTSAVVSGLSLSTSASATSGVGTYPIFASGGSAANYTVSLADSATLTVNKAPLTIAAPSNVTRPYGQPNGYVGLGFTTSGLRNGDDLHRVVPDLNFTTTATEASPIGTYPITGSGSSANYSITFVPGLLTISKALLTITANNAARFYGDANPALTSSISGLVGGDTAAVVSGLTLATTATPASNAGTYAITPSGASAGSNYDIRYVPGTLTVNKAPLTVAIDNATRTYGAQNPAFTAMLSGLKNGDTTAKIMEGIALTTTANARSAVGTYPITAGGASAQNYALTFTPGVLTVDKAKLTLTPMQLGVFIYGDSTLPHFGFTADGFVNGDSEFDFNAFGITYHTDAGPSSPAGQYPLTMTGGSMANYDLVYRPGRFIVARAPLTVKIADATRVFGDANPAFSATFTGLRNGDTAESLSAQLHLATAATPRSNVGSYAILPAGTLANYQFDLVPGALHVTPRPLAVATNPASMTYGDSLPTFTYSVAGLLPGDAAAVVGVEFAALPNLNVSGPGAYTIRLANTGISTNANYTTVAGVQGSLLVQPRTLVLEGPVASASTSAIPSTVAMAQPTLVSGGPQFSVVGRVTPGSTIVSGSVIPIVPEIVPTGSASVAQIERYYRFVFREGVLNIAPLVLTLDSDQIAKDLEQAQRNFDAALEAAKGSTLRIHDHGVPLLGTRDFADLMKGDARWFAAAVKNLLANLGDYDFTPDTLALLRRAAGGDSSAWSLLMDRYYLDEDLRGATMELIGSYTMHLLQPTATPRTEAQNLLLTALGTRVQSMRAEVAQTASDKYLQYQREENERRMSENLNALVLSARGLFGPPSDWSLKEKDIAQESKDQVLAHRLANAAAGVAGLGAGIVFSLPKVQYAVFPNLKKAEYLKDQRGAKAAAKNADNAAAEKLAQTLAKETDNQLKDLTQTLSKNSGPSLLSKVKSVFNGVKVGAKSTGVGALVGVALEFVVESAFVVADHAEGDKNLAKYKQALDEGKTTAKNLNDFFGPGPRPSGLNDADRTEIFTALLEMFGTTAPGWRPDTQKDRINLDFNSTPKAE